MKNQMKAVEYGNSLGMKFHVFCDSDDWVKDELVGNGSYHSSWRSKEVAFVVASKQVNSFVLNMDGEKILDSVEQKP